MAMILSIFITDYLILRYVINYYLHIHFITPYFIIISLRCHILIFHITGSLLHTWHIVFFSYVFSLSLSSFSHFILDIRHFYFNIHYFILMSFHYYTYFQASLFTLSFLSFFAFRYFITPRRRLSIHYDCRLRFCFFIFTAMAFWYGWWYASSLLAFIRYWYHYCYDTLYISLYFHYYAF